MGFGCLLYGFSILSDQGKGIQLALTFLIVGFAVSFLFVKRQFKLAVPLLDFNVFRYPRFTYASIIGVVLFIVMAGVELLLPIYAQNVRGLLPRESGVMLPPDALLMGVSGVVSGKIYDRYGGRYLIRIGFFGIATVTVLLTIALSIHAPYGLLVGLYALLMTGVGFMMTPITGFAIASLPNSMMNYASPMTTAIRTFGMSMGGALLIPLVTITADYSSLSFPINMHQGIQAAFWSLALVAASGFLLTFFVPYGKGSVES